MDAGRRQQGQSRHSPNARPAHAARATPVNDSESPLSRPAWDLHVTVATVVADAHGRLLLIEEQADRPLPGREWVLNQPAGHLEADETLQDAARRETLEESGWDVRLSSFIGTYQWRTDDGRDYLRFAFGAEPVAHHPERPLDTGIVRALWMSPDELAQARPRLRSPLVWQAAQDWLAGRRYPLDLVRHVP